MLKCNEFKKESLRSHSPLHGSVSGLMYLLPLSCLPLSILWPLPPAFEAGRPSLLLPDRIPHILWETGRSPAPCPRQKICVAAASSNPFTLLRLPTTKVLLKVKIETTVNTFLSISNKTTSSWETFKQKTDQNQFFEVHLKSMRIQTADTSLPEPLLGGLA